MEELEKHGLVNNGLIIIDRIEEVRRYNACLVDMGLESTALTHFRIDGMGWSPDIAVEKNDQYYLSHGEASRLTIVLTPDQINAPIYNPAHSYDWELMKQWFNVNRAAIEVVTRYCGIWLILDQGVHLFHDPEDLLLLDGLIVRSMTPPRLMEQAKRQKEYVRTFSHNQPSLYEALTMLMDIPLKLEASVEAIGNLAHKAAVINDMSFEIPRSFFTRAQGGWFVVRSPDGEKEILLSRDHAKDSPGVTSVRDKKILQSLDRLGLISYDVERWKGRLHRLRIIRDSFLMETLDRLYADMDYVALNPAKKKGVLKRKKVKEDLSDEYFLLDKVIRKLEKGQISKKVRLSIKPYLAHPVETLDKATKEVVWYILALVCDGRNIVRLFRYDKKAFYKLYDSWEKPRQSWARSSIIEYHQSKHIIKSDEV